MPQQASEQAQLERRGWKDCRRQQFITRRAGRKWGIIGRKACRLTKKRQKGSSSTWTKDRRTQEPKPFKRVLTKTQLEAGTGMGHRAVVACKQLVKFQWTLIQNQETSRKLWPVWQVKLAIHIRATKRPLWPWLSNLHPHSIRPLTIAWRTVEQVRLAVNFRRLSSKICQRVRAIIIRPPSTNQRTWTCHPTITLMILICKPM